MNSKLARIKAIAAELHEMFPGTHPDISFNPETGFISIGLHRCSYQVANDSLRGLGFGKRGKQILESEGRAFTALNAWDSEAQISATAYTDELPPCCHIETVTQRIPKTQTVDTGDFIEVQKSVVVCPQSEVVA